MASKLKGKEEGIWDMLLDGKTYKQISSFYEVSLSTLHEYINKAEFSARTRAALEVSASSYADKAEEVLIKAVNDRGELMRARELAQHYRWKAGKRNPKKYGDKVQHSNDPDNPISPPIININHPKT